MMVDLVGESLGPYTITERIGRGGMADVYKAFHKGLSVYRAVKVIRPELVTSDDFRARFQKEAQAVAQLRHPNIVQVHDFGTHGSAYYMVMEFIEGRDLKKVLVAEGALRPIRRAVELVLHIASALEYAHGRGLIHRDIKPENVMIAAGGQPILTDFGIAKLVTSGTHLTQTGFGIGTPAYMSPEQAQGLTDVGPTADIYALTVVLYELLTGRVPFAADTPIAVIMKAIKDPLPMPRTLRPDISEALQAVMIKGTAKLPTERYATVVELRAALERALDDTASNTSPARSTLVRSGAGTRELHEEPMATRRLSFAWVAGAFVVLAAGAGGYVWIARDSTATPSVSPQASLVVPLTVTETAVAQPAPDISAAQSAATDLASSASGAGGVTEPTDDATRPQAPVGSNPLREAPRLATKPVETTSREVDRGAAKIAVTPPNGKSTVAVQPALNIQAPVSVVPPLSAPVSEVSDVSIAAAPSPAPSPNSEPSSDASAPGGLSRVIKGVTRQSDLLKLFGGPNLTTLDAQGRDVWVYERTVTQTDTRSAANIASGNADFGVFWGTGEAGASASTDQSATMLSSGSSIRTVTAIVTFDGDRTVLDYTVKANYF